VIVLGPDGHERTVEHIAIFYAQPEVTGGNWHEMRECNTR